MQPRQPFRPRCYTLKAPNTKPKPQPEPVYVRSAVIEALYIAPGIVATVLLLVALAVNVKDLI